VPIPLPPPGSVCALLTFAVVPGCRDDDDAACSRVPQGPKDKHTPAFHERTLLFEEAAAAQAAAGEGSPVFVYTASPDVVEGLLGPVGPAVDPAHVSPVMDVPALFQGEQGHLAPPHPPVKSFASLRHRPPMPAPASLHVCASVRSLT